MDIRKFMNDFNNTNRQPFNLEWFKRNDDDIINGMKQIILSYERDKYFVIKVLEFEVITLKLKMAKRLIMTMRILTLEIRISCF